MEDQGFIAFLAIALILILCYLIKPEWFIGRPAGADQPAQPPKPSTPNSPQQPAAPEPSTPNPQQQQAAPQPSPASQPQPSPPVVILQPIPTQPIDQRVSKILIYKDNNKIQNNDFLGDSMEISELKAYRLDGSTLEATDFVAEYDKDTDFLNYYTKQQPLSLALDKNPNTYATVLSRTKKPSVVFNLKTPTELSKVEVYTRGGSSDLVVKRRDVGTQIELYNSSGILLKQLTLGSNPIYSL